MPRRAPGKARLLWALARFLAIAFPVNRVLPFHVRRTYLANACLWCALSVALALLRLPARNDLAAQAFAGLLNGLVVAVLVTGLVWLLRRRAQLPRR